MQDLNYGANEFTYKGQGLIFVLNEYDLSKVKDILKHLDDYEFTHYFNPNCLKVFPDKNIVCFPWLMEYVGKFDLHIDFKKECIKQKVAAYVYDESTDSTPLSVIQLILEDTNRKLKESIDASKSKVIDQIMSQREEILEAFVAKYGLGPNEAVQITQCKNGETLWYVTTKDKIGVQQ